MAKAPPVFPTFPSESEPGSGGPSYYIPRPARRPENIHAPERLPRASRQTSHQRSRKNRRLVTAAIPLRAMISNKPREASSRTRLRTRSRTMSPCAPRKSAVSRSERRPNSGFVLGQVLTAEPLARGGRVPAGSPGPSPAGRRPALCATPWRRHWARDRGSRRSPPCTRCAAACGSASPAGPTFC